MRIEGKKSILLFFVFLYIPSIPLFLLSSAGNFTQFITTMVYLTIGIACIALLGGWLKSDDKYYRNFSGTYLIIAIATGLGMIVLSFGLSLQLRNPNMLLAINSVSPLGLTASPTSVVTFFLFTLLYGLVMPATSEELLKLTMFAEGRKRWLHGYKIGKLTIPGVIVYAGVPVAFWSALHGLEAFRDPIMILPAFVNGIILIVVLYKTESILTCVFAHFLYNSGILTISYFSGTANIPSGMPLFPNPFNITYFQNSGYISDALTLFLLIAAFLFFLLPSLTSKRNSR